MAFIAFSVALMYRMVYVTLIFQMYRMVYVTVVFSAHTTSCQSSWLCDRSDVPIDSATPENATVGAETETP